MRYLALVVFLVLCTPSAIPAGPLPDGAVLLARRNDDRQRPARGTVVIKGRDGKVTGVERPPKERRGDRNGEREQGREQERPGQGGGRND